MYSKLLHYSLINTFILFLLSIFDWKSGLLKELFLADSTRINYLMLCLFIVVVFLGGLQTWACERDNARLSSSRVFAFIDASSSWFFIFGMIGTLIGIFISLQAVDATSVRDLDGTVGIITQLIVGLKTEISASVYGAVFGLWTELIVFLVNGADNK